jgi:uncharacterized damage-inducible protein DinB
MTAKTDERQALSTLLTGRWELTAAKLADLAREFPEDQYDAAPTEGVRTFGDVLRHVAFWNQYVAQTARGRKADDTANELPKSKYATKAQLIAALTESAGDTLAALREQDSGLSADQMALAESFIEHTCEHYGQLVVYARRAGVVPPGSR